MGATVKLEIVASNSNRLDISDITNFIWQGHAGFGLANLHRLLVRGPQQMGDTDMGYLLDPRMIQLTIRAMGANIEDMYTKQAQLLNYCAPSNTPISLCFTRLTSGIVRQLDCFAVGGLDFATTERRGYTVATQIMLRANDPTWYDPTPGYIGFISPGAGMAVPIAVPISFATVGNINASTSINYPGTADAYFWGTLTGPITNPVITFTDGVSTFTLDFTGTTITAGNFFTIDSRSAYKLVTYTDGSSQIGTLSTASNMATIAINKCNPGEAVHTTAVTLTGTSGSAATRLNINYYNRYVGV